MIIRESGEDGGAGHELRFTDLHFDPLDYAYLSNAKLDQPMTVPARWPRHDYRRQCP
jgi:hypothetical protein